MITAQTIFDIMVRETGKIPTEEEFMDKGYSRATYYRCKKNYKAPVKIELRRETEEEKEKRREEVRENVKENIRKELKERSI